MLAATNAAFIGRPFMLRLRLFSVANASAALGLALALALAVVVVVVVLESDLRSSFVLFVWS